MTPIRAKLRASWAVMFAVILLAGCGPDQTQRQANEGTAATIQAMQTRTALLTPSALADPGPAPQRDGPLRPNDTTTAQQEMNRRIDADVAAYADLIGLGAEWVRYCGLKLITELPSLTNEYPFGPYSAGTSQWTHMRTWREVNDAIAAREQFERGYLILCLADTHSRLVQANRPAASPAS